MQQWAVDTHVHFHKCFEESIFFDLVFDKLKNSFSSAPSGSVLFFAESKNENFFNTICKKKFIRSTLHENLNYSIEHDEGKNFFIVNWNECNLKIIVISGFQIVTKEKLEVLALGTAARIVDGLPIEETISNVNVLGGIPVIPWGFGKWYGKRGIKIKELIEKNRTSFFLGDNGGRSNILPTPSQFKLAEANCIKILPGSDPLPFSSEVERPLSYGFLINTDLEVKDPWLFINKIMLNQNFTFEKFGKLTSPLNFIKTQLLMQIKKRRH